MVALGVELRITPELKHVWTQTLAQLSGAGRRVFMASVIKGLVEVVPGKLRSPWAGIARRYAKGCTN